MMNSAERNRTPATASLLAITMVVAGAWSAWRPADYATWAFELLPGTAATLVLLWLAISGRFRFSAIVYLFCAVQFVVLAAGAKYTYTDMPLFNWLRDALELSRNHFDRVGHFLQGLTPTLVARELLVRRSDIRRPLAGLLAISVAVAFSACYEIIEWLWVVAFYPTQGPQWLGMQGDPWDAQADMLMALCGGVFVVMVLAQRQDRQISELSQPEAV
jgi:putative membrane protein